MYFVIKLNWQINSAEGGHLELKKMIANQLKAERGVDCGPSQILITHGTSKAYSKLLIYLLISGYSHY